MIKAFPGIVTQRDGFAAIEAMLALPIILAMILGTLSSGSLLFTKNDLNSAVSQAAHYATDNPLSSDAEIKAMVLANYHGSDVLSSSAILVSHGESADDVRYIEVQAKVQTRLPTVFFRAPGITLVSREKAYVS